MSGDAAELGSLGWSEVTTFRHLGNEVSQWVHQCGLRLTTVAVPGPLFDVFMPLATPCQGRDDGCPHTLEHLIFLGSNEYPYKGILDKVATRNLSRGTNAYTVRDHTCYTLTTAGSEGALAMLPVYLDHLLWPTITDEGFKTEVHHINGKGESSGVVYSEMQAKENSQGACVLNAQQKLMWKGCDLSCISGGLMKDLRELSVDTVRKFHRDHYRPDNLGVVLIGDITPVRGARALVTVIQKIAKSDFPTGLPRPWSDPLPGLQGTVRETVRFPSEDEDGGWMVQFGWRGPRYREAGLCAELYVLLKFLTDTAISPLRKALVDCADPVAGRISAWPWEGQVLEYIVPVRDVRKENADKVEGRLMAALREAADKIDLDLIRATARKHKLRYLEQFESNAGEAYGDLINYNIIYGDRSDPGSLQKHLDEVPAYDAMQELTAQDWEKRLREWFIDAPYVCIIGQPSKEEATAVQSEERARNEATRERLGEQKLAELEADVKRANEVNERPIPEGFESRFKVPSADSISFFPCRTVRTDDDAVSDPALKAILDKGGTEALPLSVQFNEVNTRFVTVTAWMDLADVPRELLPYVELFLELCFERPVSRPGRELSFDEVIAAINREAVNWNATQGLYRQGNFSAGNLPYLTQIRLKFPGDSYASAVQWLSDLLYHTKFPPERVAIAATKLIDRIATLRREPSSLLRAAVRRLRLPEGHIELAINALRQEQFLKGVAADPAAAAERLAALTRAMSTPKALRVHCVANFSELAASGCDPKAPWLDFVPASAGPPVFAAPLQPSAAPWPVEKPRCVLVPLDSTESSYVTRMVPFKLHSTDPVLASVRVATELYTTSEGPFWKEIRGNGYAYHYHLFQSPADTCELFAMHKCSQAGRAWEVADKLVAGGPRQWTENDLIGARSANLFSLISREETVGQAAREAFLNLLREEPLGYNRQAMKHIQAVTEKDVAAVSTQYIKSVFDPSAKHAVMAIVCNPNQVQTLSEEFSAFAPEVISAQDLFAVSGCASTPQASLRHE